MKEKIDVLKEVISAWCERQDIDAVLANLDENVEWHFAAVSAPPVRGHAGARKFLEDYGGRVRNPKWRIFSYAENDNALFVEGVDEFELKSGGTNIVPYMGVLEFNGDKIIGWRDYFDRRSADSSAKGEPLPDHVRKLTERQALPGLGG